ncbi:MAG: hypothetical protein CMI54_02055 [Parcubacteria group bacterium]|jgi:hypothetical protein|nr:hypothetical protein [Parcubacteria group bacterium]|tara:strand:- start:2574 stop:2849 length:276 start_codon:yes stop_codon:yes gene_type:complete
MNNYQVKNLKTFPSREFGPTGGWSCNLYKGLLKIAEAFQAGDGGDARIEYISKKEKDLFSATFKGKSYDAGYGFIVDYDDELQIIDLMNQG